MHSCSPNSSQQEGQSRHSGLGLRWGSLDRTSACWLRNEWRLISLIWKIQPFVALAKFALLADLDLYTGKERHALFFRLPEVLWSRSSAHVVQDLIRFLEDVLEKGQGHYFNTWISDCLYLVMAQVSFNKSNSFTVTRGKRTGTRPAQLCVYASGSRKVCDSDFSQMWKRWRITCPIMH